MDSGTTIIGLMFLLFCVIIFMVMISNNRKKEKKLLQSLENMAKENKCKIVQFDIWNNSVIGIDDATSVLFAIRNAKEESISSQIDLSEMKSCRVEKTNRVTDDNDFKEIEKLELVFTHKDKTIPDIFLHFYNREYDTGSLSGELQLIEKWNTIANNTIRILSINK
ncbi:hypothetical protein LK994_12975 [Ferruginibacter lapsinanis]|uniref:hypothetical protein n=1 Tax=Ferruginibacter lapsinanis TaxID=563172 RepID=UPI001E35E9A3|nr:hypothetical protein [Ferruginibacter lapsinanis]UEG49547.1 hypothetical protein LK994_12975 [Ferruginibacter lapsinanis]